VAEPSGSPPGLTNRNRKQSLTATPIFEFLTAGTVKRDKLRHRAKFFAEIWRFFDYEDDGRLQLLNFRNINGRNGQEGQSASSAKFRDDR